MALRTRARSTRLLVVALVSISLVTITVDYREGTQGPLASLGDGALAVISPLQEVVSKVTHPIGNFFSTLVRLPSIRHERDVLRERVDALETELAEGRADQARLAELEALFGLQESLGNRIETTAAQVIANGVSNFEWTITIDEGSSSGIAVGMPVVSSAGLVGHVVRVGSSSSIVQLIIDPDSSVAGRLDVSRQTGLLSGAGPSDLEMSLVDPTGRRRPGRARRHRRLPHRRRGREPVPAQHPDRDGLAGPGRGLRHREAPHGPARGGLLLPVPRARGALP